MTTYLRLLASLIAAALVASLLAVPASAEAGFDQSTFDRYNPWGYQSGQVITQAEAEAVVLHQINLHRERAGLPPVSPAVTNSHTECSLSTMFHSATFQHFSSCIPDGNAENAHLTLSLFQIVDPASSWHDSPGHNANMYSTSVTSVEVSLLCGVPATGMTTSTTTYPAGLQVVLAAAQFRGTPGINYGWPEQHFRSDFASLRSDDVFYDTTGVYCVDGTWHFNLDRDIGLPPSISGSVTGSNGEPLSGVAVRASQPGQITATTVTDAAGRYQFGGLASGEWTIDFTDPTNHHLNITYDTPITVAWLHETQGIDVSLPEAGTLTGYVVSPDDTPLASATVTAVSIDQHDVPSPIETSSDGTFTLHLQPGTYTLRVDPPSSAMIPTWSGSVSNEADATWFTIAPGQHLDHQIAMIATPPPGSAVDAIDDIRAINENWAIVISVLANDYDVVDPAVTLISGPANGTATVNASNSIQYTPTRNWDGTDSFGYRVCTSAGACDEATVWITVIGYDNPQPADDHYAVPSHQAPYVVPAPGLLTNDSGTNLRASLDRYPTAGSVTVNADGGFTYTPDGETCGPVPFRYTAADNNFYYEYADVTLDIACPAPIATTASPPTTTTTTTTPTTAPTTTSATTVRRNLPLDQAASLDEVLASRDYDVGRDGDTMRLYRAFFDRDPDVVGAKYWLAQSQNGIDYDEVAWGFANSTEFRQTYGDGITNYQFLDVVYTNVLGRTPDADGFDYWLAQLNNGLDRHLVVRWIAVGHEFQTRFPYWP
ncbi:MAG: DUF4214 domain-containing protein [Acidimicrobiales bacterium]